MRLLDASTAADAVFAQMMPQSERPKGIYKVILL